MNSAKKLIQRAKGLLRAARSIHDALALIQLRPLVSNYIPFSGMAMSPAEIARICNDILVNKRKKVVELGCGASTVFIAKILGDGCEFYSVDHDENWIAVVKEWLEREGLADRVQFIHAPLVPISIGSYSGTWYDPIIIGRDLPTADVQCLIVDGPPATEDNPLARFPAGPMMAARLSERVSIYLDDAIRDGEREIARRWEQDLGIRFKFRIDNGGYAVGVRGPAYMD